jgi:hypothetical protein
MIILKMLKMMILFNNVWFRNYMKLCKIKEKRDRLVVILLLMNMKMEKNKSSQRKRPDHKSN